jgi:hypothetical protein
LISRARASEMTTRAGNSVRNDHRLFFRPTIVPACPFSLAS